MEKVKYTASKLLSIVEQIYDRCNKEISDADIPSAWKGNTIKDALNCEYYVYKYRPLSEQAEIEKIIANSMNNGEQVNTLASLDKSFALVSMGAVDRVYEQNVDIASVDLTIEYWVQTNKIALLAELVEICNSELSGTKQDVNFGEEEREEKRRATIVFGAPQVVDVQEGLPCGEMAVVTVTASFYFTQPIYSYADYKVTFEWGENNSVELPLTGITVSNTMVQKAIPLMGNTSKTGSLNLSSADIIVISFMGFDNEFVNYITKKTLSGQVNDNNEEYTVTFTRGGVSWERKLVIKEHTIEAKPSPTAFESHTLTLAQRGYINGFTQS